MAEKNSRSKSPAVQSATWPPVKRKAIGRHRLSVRAWIFVVSPTTRSADRLILFPPLPPEAQRCAFTAEESMSASAGVPPAETRAWKMSTQMPLAAHRTKRL